MQNASSTSSSHQLATTPTTESALSRASAAYGGGQGGGNEPPPSSPRFNLPDSYWSRFQDYLNAELLTRPTGFSEFVARHVAQSRQGQDNFFKATERHQDDRENDPRARIQGLALQINTRLFQVPDFSLSAEALDRLVVLKIPRVRKPSPSRARLPRPPQPPQPSRTTLPAAAASLLPARSCKAVRQPPQVSAFLLRRRITRSRHSRMLASFFAGSAPCHYFHPPRSGRWRRT
jgi:hypothetical protein